MGSCWAPSRLGWYPWYMAEFHISRLVTSARCVTVVPSLSYCLFWNTWVNLPLWCMAQPLLLSGWTIAQGNFIRYITMHSFMYCTEKLKLCWSLVSEYNPSQYIDSPSLLYRLMDHSKLLILLIVPWYVCIYCH